MQHEEEGFSFKSLFVPLTNFKVVIWILVIGLVVYSNSLFNGFVGDDFPQIVNNPYVQSASNILAFFTGGTFYNGNNHALVGVYYKPLLNTVFSLIYTFFFSFSAFPFHAIQIAMHILNTCILFLFLKYFFKQRIAFLLALIFLIHPINSEAVFSISGMQEPLFFFFGIFAFLLLTYFKSIKSLLLVVLLLFLSFLSKETGVLFAIIISVYTIIFDRKRIYPLFIAIAVIAGMYFLLRSNTLGILRSPVSSPIDALTLGQRMLNVPEIFFFYFKTFFFPLYLASSYRWTFTQLSFSHFLLPLMADSIFIILIVYLSTNLYRSYSKKYFEIFIFFCSWLLLGILFHLQIIPLDYTVSERWFYFPMVGLLGMIGILLEVYKYPYGKKLSIIFLLCILVLLSVRTYQRSFDWKNNLILATHDIQVSPQAFDLENQISLELINQGDFQEAKTHAERSIKLYPYFTNYISLGLAYYGLGDYRNSKEAYLKTLQFGDYYQVYENLSGLAVIYGDPDQNIKFIKQSLKKFPTDSKIWLYLAIIEYQQKDISNAKEAVAQAYSYSQDSQTAYVYEHIMNGLPVVMSTGISK